MIEKCARCGVRSDLVKLYDAIYNNEMSLLCERCSIIENVPIIQKPTSNQLKIAEKRATSVEERLKEISGLKKQTSKNNNFSPKERLKELEKNPKLEIPEEKRLDLIDYFGWEIMKQRRRKGLSQNQLAEILQESVTAIDMLEKGKIPRDSENLIKKIEQFLQIKLRKSSYFDNINKETPILLDSFGNRLNKLPEGNSKQSATIVVVEEVNPIFSRTSPPKLELIIFP